jgi:cytidylate kinase
MDGNEKIQEILKNIVITIDGPAGSGKSTTAARLADRLGLTYLDTGAMYRAVTYQVLREKIDPEDAEMVSRVAQALDLRLEMVDCKPALHLSGKNIEKEIRKPEVARYVSPVSRHKGVREAMVKIQRRIAMHGGIVAEGRDTGSVVFPFAHVKIYLVADIDARTSRRVDQLAQMGIPHNADEVKDNILDRDSIDSGREHSPLLRPPGSYVIDTSNISIDEQLRIAESHVRDTAGRLSKLAVWRREKDPFAAMSLYYRISHFLVRAFFKIFFGLHINGEEHVRYRENYIFASNHISYGDPPIVGCALNREVWFMAKKELFRNRIFAWLIRTYHAIPVDRDEIDRKTLRLVMDKLEHGDSILMFPEGTRSKTGSIAPLKVGLGFIAINTGRSVVPIYVTGTNRLGACMLRRQRLAVHIGPPIRIPDGYTSPDRKADYQVLSSMVHQEMKMLKNESES